MKQAILKLARESIKNYLETGQILTRPANLPHKLLQKQAGVFVSLHLRSDHSLRGCIGTFLPVRKNLAEEIIHNAIAAASQDPRFPPVALREFGNLEIAVDILSPPKMIAKEFRPDRPLPAILDARKFGLIVSAGNGRKGLLLPDIPGVKSPSEQIKICLAKAGISNREKVNLEIFTVLRYSS
ncbi:MAG: AmmeMemoRadiSam system protein A [Candidatus Pacebacteria bacterium]|nr:AmmeMemoRadiSam system protein A [Candidatus Paceibacterota bacterium]